MVQLGNPKADSSSQLQVLRGHSLAGSRSGHGRMHWADVSPHELQLGTKTRPSAAKPKEKPSLPGQYGH
jgi:hypothetical protein